MRSVSETEAVAICSAAGGVLTAGSLQAASSSAAKR